MPKGIKYLLAVIAYTAFIILMTLIAMGMAKSVDKARGTNEPIDYNYGFGHREKIIRINVDGIDCVAAGRVSVSAISCNWNNPTL